MPPNHFGIQIIRMAYIPSLWKKKVSEYEGFRSIRAANYLSLASLPGRSPSDTFVGLSGLVLNLNSFVQGCQETATDQIHMAKV